MTWVAAAKCRAFCWPPGHHVCFAKVDGWRVLAYKTSAGVRLVSRSGRDLTRRFPELAAAVAALEPPTLVLDGEIAVFDRHLVAHFEWIRARPKDEAATPPTLIAFTASTPRAKDLRKRPRPIGRGGRFPGSR